MRFSTFANHINKLEHVSSRNEMTLILADLLKEAKPDEIDKLVYLSLGRLGPLYDQADLGLSGKLMIKVIARTTESSDEEVLKRSKELGDLGDAVHALKEKNEATRSSHVSVIEVFDELILIGKAAGAGSQDRKITLMSGLLMKVDATSSRYIVRIALNKLRLGFSDMTIIDALSWMVVGDKSLKAGIEGAYNISADIGKLAQLIKTDGAECLKHISIQVGIPIRPAGAERLPGAQEIIDKLGTVAAEPKIDGFRLQVHYERKTGKVTLFSRNLEPMSDMFPEVTAAVSALNVDSIVFEGEAVAYNPDTEEFLPFQETLQRRRKHNIEEMSKAIPLKVFGFDLLFLNGENYLTRPYTERRAALGKVLGDSKTVIGVIEESVFADGTGLAKFFMEQIEHGLEGIVAKRLDAPYSAGARNFNWVKLKREEKSELNDSVDCLVLGYALGQGKRTQFGIGAFLVGVYNEESDTFESISKVGTGLSDEQWREMKRRADELKVATKPVRYNVAKELEQDVWISPSMVVEIRADEITRSPVHTAGKVDGSPGYALRFPRLIKWRDDKRPEQATSVKEITELYAQG